MTITEVWTAEVLEEIWTADEYPTVTWEFLIGANTSGGGGAGVTDHGDLTGLDDDDHPQYALADGTRGDYATTAQGDLADTAVQPADVGTAAARNVGTGSSDLPTTADVDDRIAVVVGTAPANLDTLGELAAALETEGDAVAALVTTVAGKQPHAAHLDELSALGADGFVRRSSGIIIASTAADTRTALGLGTAATTAASDYATAAQGTKADAAVADPGGSNDDLLQRKSGAWTHRTLAQVATDLGVAPVWPAMFGDGSDGAVTISSNTTITRPMFYSALTVNSGVTLSTDAFPVFVAGLLTLNGNIANNASGSTAAPPGTLADRVGVGGGSGGQATGGGGTAGSSLSGGASRYGAAGGAGGAGAGGAGGAGGSSSAANDALLRNGMGPFITTTPLNGGNRIGGGTGGGSGGPASSAAGGNGGGGGGCTYVAAAHVTGTGKIQANGAAGAAAVNANTGGGGGGGGGFAILVTNTTSPAVTVEALGGAGGAGNGTGSAGSAGSNGKAITVKAGT